jgi:uncharacterized membrane protein
MIPNPTAPQKPVKSKRRTFLTGLIVAAPILVTLWLVTLLFDQVSSYIAPALFGLARFFGFAGEPMRGWIETIVQLLSVGVGALGIFLIGLLAENVLGRQLLRGLEWLLMQIPFIRGIYSATRQFLETFSGDSTKAFRKVVLFEYPRKGLWTMGLLTGDAKGEVAQKVPQKMVSVFVPTTPNPTSGWLIFVPIESVQELEMSVDDAFKMIISGGVLTPGVERAESSQSTEEV